MNKYICFNKNESYTYEVEKILINNKLEILDFFEVEDSEVFDFNIYIYKTLNDLYKVLNKKGIITNNTAYYLRKENTFYFYEPFDYNKKLYKKNIINEEVKAIECLIYGNHPKWLVDGITMYLDKDISIKKVLEDSYIDEELEPYKSYIIVSYLIEKYQKSLFIRLILLQSFIDFVEEGNIFKEAIDYYRNIYKNKEKTKDKS